MKIHIDDGYIIGFRKSAIIRVYRYMIGRITLSLQARQRDSKRLALAKELILLIATVTPPPPPPPPYNYSIDPR